MNHCLNTVFIRSTAPLLLLSFFACSASAQSLYCFAEDSTTIWKELDWGTSDGGQTYGLTTYVFEIAGTDSINGLEYKKISRQWHSWTSNSGIGGTHIGDQSGFDPYVYAVREDAGKVYCIEPSTGDPERLIYDFTIGIGDSLPSPRMVGTQTFHEVVAMDSILIGNEYRKTWITSIGYDCIDGLGNQFGPFSQYGAWTDFENNLICYTQNDTLLFNNPITGTDCNYTILELGIADVETMSFFSVHYHPNKTELRLKTEERQMNYQLFTTTGKLVESGAEEHAVSWENGTHSAGMYIVRVVSGTSVQTKKLMLR